MQTDLVLKFADGDYLFALKLPQLLELQRVCEAGIFVIYGRVLRGRYVLQDSEVAFGVPHECEAFVNDVYETIRLGLIGGGQGLVNGEEVPINALRARQLVETYCHPAPLKECWDIAAAVLSAKIEGYEGQKKSPEPGAKPPKGSTKQKSSQTAP